MNTPMPLPHTGDKDTDTPIPDIVHHDDLWFPDGNIVLITSSGVSYRVHQGVLARHSVVFRDMFTVPQPNDSEKIGGCPFVHISDASEDVVHILQALYDRTYFSPNSCQPLSVVSAILRLATKYEFKHLRGEAIQRLEKCFPNNLDAWDLARETAQNKRVILYEEGQEISIFNLARLCNVPSVLTAVLYACCQLETSLLLDRAPHSDGTMDRLREGDLRLFLLAKDMLARCRRDMISRFMRPRRGQYGEHCQLVVAKSAQDCFGLYDPLCGSNIIGEACSQCQGALFVDYETSRVQTFNKLGEYLSPPS